MATSSEITPRDVVDALQTLTDEQSYKLFYHLEVPLHTLITITSDYKGDIRKIHYVKAWFDRDVDVSWDTIVSGLKHIGLNALAGKIASQQTTPTQQIITVTSSPPPPIESVPLTNDSPSSGLNTVACTTHSSLTSTNDDRISQVKADIDQLTDTFLDLMSDTRSEMCMKESRDQSFLDRFRDRLLSLPVAQKAPHTKFFRESEDEFLKAENMRKIFAILFRYCNYRNPEILQQLVRKFCEALLQRKMQEYCESLENFEKATTVDIYLVAISACEDLSLAFTRMTMKINKPASVCTLHEIRKMKEALVEKASLQSYGMYIESMSESSVLLVLGFPPSCVGWVLAAMTPEFMDTHLLSDVTVDQQQLTIEPASQMRLVCLYYYVHNMCIGRLHVIILTAKHYGQVGASLWRLSRVKF